MGWLDKEEPNIWSMEAILAGSSDDLDISSEEDTSEDVIDYSSKEALGLCCKNLEYI